MLEKRKNRSSVERF